MSGEGITSVLRRVGPTSTLCPSLFPYRLSQILPRGSTNRTHGLCGTWLCPTRRLRDSSATSPTQSPKTLGVREPPKPNIVQTSKSPNLDHQTVVEDSLLMSDLVTGNSSSCSLGDRELPSFPQNRQNLSKSTSNTVYNHIPY